MNSSRITGLQFLDNYRIKNKHIRRPVIAVIFPNLNANTIAVIANILYFKGRQFRRVKKKTPNTMFHLHEMLSISYRRLFLYLYGATSFT